MLINLHDHPPNYTPSLFQWPTHPFEWQVVADDFQAKWNVPNCLGAVVQKRVRVESSPEYEWMFQDESRGTMDPHFILCLAVDASYRFLYVGADCPGCDDGQLLYKIEAAKFNVPTPKPTKNSSGSKRLFTFVGPTQILRKQWLRSLSDTKDSYKDQDEKREIERGLKVAETAHNILLDRFRVLHTKIPTGLCKLMLKLSQTIACLHNYFLDTNPDYAPEHVVKRKYNTFHQSSPPHMNVSPSVQRQVLAMDKDWMDQLHMTDDTLQYLLNLTMPHMLKQDIDVHPEILLRITLRFMATGNGYDCRLGRCVKNTLKALDKSLQKYAGAVSSCSAIGQDIVLFNSFFALSDSVVAEEVVGNCG